MNAVMLTLFMALAAGSGRSYPVSGQFEVATSGPSRVDLTGDWLARCPDPTSYLITDAAGAEVPFAIRTSDQHPPKFESLRWEPVQISASHWSYRVHRPASKAPVRALRVKDLPRGVVARVEFGDARGRHQASTLIWNLPDTEAGLKDQIPLPDTLSRGPWRVDVEILICWFHWRPRVAFDALTEHTGQVSPVAIEVPVEAPFPLSASHSELVLRLPRDGLPVRWVGVDPEETLFSRPVVVRGEQASRVTRATLERIELGGESVDKTRIPRNAEAGRQISIDVDDGRSPVLTVQHVEVGLRGAALLLPDASPGTYAIVGCGPSGRGYDLDRVSETLSRQHTPRVVPGPPVLNPEWTRGLLADGIAAPVPALRGAHFRGHLAVNGDPGLIRVQVPPRVIARTREGLPDIRFTTDDDHVVPHVLATSGSERLQIARWAQEEVGAMTRVRIAMTDANLPVERLVLRTERARFERTVFVKADGDIVARGHWVGTGEGGSRLVLELNRRMPQTIVVEMDNGDSLALPLLEPELTMAVSEARLIAPSEGSLTLSYGSQRLRRPVYDLQLVRSQLLDSPATSAVLREPPVEVVEAAWTAPEPGPTRRSGSRWMILVVGGLAASVGGLALRLATEADQDEAPR